MKALKFFILVSIGLVLSSCSMEDEINVQEITSKNVIAEIKATGAKGIPFPEGSKATTLGSKDFVKITLPEDVYYVIKDEEGNVSRVSTLGIRCKCLKGAGCSPGTYDGRYFCTAELGACSLCEVHAGLIESLSAKGEQKEVQIVGVMDEREDKFGAYAKRGGFGQIEREKEPTIQYGITEDFFKCKEVHEALMELYSAVYRTHYDEEIPDFIKSNSDTIPSDHVYIRASLFGNTVFLPTPKELAIEAGLEMVDDISKIHCTCSQGTGCTKDRVYVVVFCNAGNCSDCTMSK
ncbi:hypothetical protein [Bergeyella cardium]|uniref:Uncharacterized protein n=1 Tax=Bergeyella cardium TaxID=1585976 RepID=A0A6P1QTC0_9FLAO|nr:hypothetical protein [Bergeyella cardium]QHN64935.1 hypothetical protein DBX24_03005 [Bergeyella cardium]WHE34248.1 hypothetical protein P8603_03030 [Bergeyella cardium]WHF60899.1 hypothetical protein O0R51_03025 [Bergeyella cardium]